MKRFIELKPNSYPNYFNNGYLTRVLEVEVEIRSYGYTIYGPNFRGGTIPEIHVIQTWIEDEEIC